MNSELADAQREAYEAVFELSGEEVTYRPEDKNVPEKQLRAFRGPVQSIVIGEPNKQLTAQGDSFNFYRNELEIRPKKGDRIITTDGREFHVLPNAEGIISRDNDRCGIVVKVFVKEPHFSDE